MLQTMLDPGKPATAVRPGAVEPGRAGGKVRRFSGADVLAVADLHRRAARATRVGELRSIPPDPRYFSRVFLDELWDGSEVGSLVHEGEGGAITGFLGVVPRRMTMNGARLLVASCAEPVVHERSHMGLVYAGLLGALFRGPQDLSLIDEAGDVTRAVGETLGAKVAPAHSKTWTYRLRPGMRFRSPGARLSRAEVAARAAGALLRRAGELIDRRLVSPLLQDEPDFVVEQMCAGTFVEELPALTGPGRLRPDDDERTLRWALEGVSSQGPWARPEGVLLRNARGEPMGAYFHHLDPRGVEQVLQLVTAPFAAESVLRHLVRRAYWRGAIAVEGRLDRHLAPVLWRIPAVSHRDGPWVLVHSNRREIAASFEQGDPLCSRLEGSLCLRPWGPAA